MQLRAPWLSSRSRLILLGLVDVLTLWVLYNIIFYIRLGSFVGSSGGLVQICAMWLSIGYLFGVYSPQEVSREYLVKTRFLQLLGLSGTIGILVIGHSWLFNVTDVETRYRGFVVPLLFLQSVASYLVRAKTAGVGTLGSWDVVCNDEEATALLYTLKERPWEERRIRKLWRKQEFELCLSSKSSDQQVALGQLEGVSDVILNHIMDCKSSGARVLSLVDWCERYLESIPTELVDSSWFIKASGFSLTPGGVNWRVKRLGDVCVALILIVVTLPLVGIAALAIWLEDGGPVFYTQTRTGLYGKQFRIIKLRSMRTNAELYGAVWASKNDPRITRVGKWIRKTRIDELPQLLGVLNGDLSLIGPRPERAEIEVELERVIPHYRVRHWVRPGLSGWAQVSHPYGSSIEDSRAKLGYDLFYIRNASVFLDMLIFIKTVRLVVNAKGAEPKPTS